MAHDVSEEEARRIMAMTKMTALEVIDMTTGVAWTATLEYGDSEITVSQEGRGGGNKYRVNRGSNEALRFIMGAAQKLLPKLNEPLDMITSYMIRGENGMQHIDDIKRDLNAHMQ